MGLGFDVPDIKAKLAVASEIKDSMEIVHTVEYDNFLKFYLPAFKQLLKEIPPQTSETPEHKLRNQILEILNRLPHNEVLRPLCTELLELTMEVLVVENEENSTLWCVRLVSRRTASSQRGNKRTHVTCVCECTACACAGSGPRCVVRTWPQPVASVRVLRPNGAKYKHDDVCERHPTCRCRNRKVHRFVQAQFVG